MQGCFRNKIKQHMHVAADFKKNSADLQKTANLPLCEVESERGASKRWNA